MIIALVDPGSLSHVGVNGSIQGQMMSWLGSQWLLNDFCQNLLEEHCNWKL
jgi:hypothetical protein